MAWASHPHLHTLENFLRFPGDMRIRSAISLLGPANIIICRLTQSDSIQHDKHSENIILSAYSNTKYFKNYLKLPRMVPSDDKIVYVHLGERIKKARTDKGLSLRELAAICDVEHNTIHEIERGTLNFRFSTIIKISKGLEIPLYELISPH